MVELDQDDKIHKYQHRNIRTLSLLGFFSNINRHFMFGRKDISF